MYIRIGQADSEPLLENHANLLINESSFVA